MICRVMRQVGFSVAFIVFPVGAAALEYVSKDRVSELTADFSTGQAPKDSDLAKWKGRSFKCEMYGMRSRLQVDRDVRLYQFEVTESAQKVVQNRGAQVIQSYVKEATGLVGHQGSIRDEVRKCANGKIVSKLSRSSDDSSSENILAYSVCRLI